VVVPTVERGLRMLFFCRMAMAGQMPSMPSNSGSPLQRQERL
jgi:hypothetical protein